MSNNPKRLARFVHRWHVEWDTGQFGRASLILNHLIDDRPEEAWKRILALIACANETALGSVGAGPLEDLIRQHGGVFVDTIEACARENSGLRAALSNVWLSEGETELGRRLVALGCLVVPITNPQSTP
jgi:hypothetical protein